MKAAIKSILNGAHSRGGSFVDRADLDDQKKVKAYSTWRPLAFASKGQELGDGQVRRTIKIVMTKALPGEVRKQWDSLRHPKMLHELRDRIQKWVAAQKIDLKMTFPPMPPDVEHPDTWRPLFVIADMAGGSWSEKVRSAARVAPKQEEDRAVRLLRDLREVFRREGKDRLPTSLILKVLHEGEWAEMPPQWKPMTEHRLRAMLKLYGIAPLKEAFGNPRQRGYEQPAFKETWLRHGI